MTTLKWTVRIHKWIALIVGIQIMLWIAGGLVMSAIPIETVRGEHKISPTGPSEIDTTEILSLNHATELLKIDAISSATLGQVLDKPVWRIQDPSGANLIVDARSGERLDPLSEALAREIAEADYSGKGTVSSLEFVASPPSEYGRPGPVWRIQFDDGDATTLYIDPQSAEVTARRSSTWRFYDFFWKLHVMDYDDGHDHNHPLLITASGAAVFVALSGLILLIIKMRRTWLISSRRRADKSRA